jgi:UDP-glucose 4-epimerase
VRIVRLADALPDQAARGVADHGADPLPASPQEQRQFAALRGAEHPDSLVSDGVPLANPRGSLVEVLQGDLREDIREPVGVAEVLDRRGGGWTDAGDARPDRQTLAGTVPGAGMHVVVTGGRGESGRWICDHLAGDHRVTCLDRDHPGADGHPEVDYRALDLTDAGATFDALTALDPDAVVHWAAIPVAGTHTGTETYRNNTLATHAVLTAAGRIGARIVQASSDGAYGFFFAEETPLPESLPIPETHPLRPEDPYGLSKVVAEEVGATVARRDDVPVVSVRPSWIQAPGDYPCRDPAYVEDLSAGAGNFWSYVDARDVARLVGAALERDVAGHEAVNCVASDNALGESLADLFERHYGTVPEGAPDTDDSAYSLARARELFGWTPEHSWREAADADVPTPTV